MNWRRRIGAGLVVVVVVLVVVLTDVLGIPLHLLPAAIMGGEPAVDASDAGFQHVGEGPHSFSASAANLTSCGATCRNFTGTVTYTGDGTATDVRLDMRVTANGTQVWTRNRTLGQLAADDRYELVQEADIGFEGSGEVLENDGYVTVWIEVVHADGRETLKKRLKAA